MRKIDIDVVFQVTTPKGILIFDTREEALKSCGKPIRVEFHKQLYIFKSTKDAKWFHSLSTKNQEKLLKRAYKKHFLDRKVTSVKLLKRYADGIVSVTGRGKETTIMNVIQCHQVRTTPKKGINAPMYSPFFFKHGFDQLVDTLESYGLSLDMDLTPFI